MNLGELLPVVILKVYSDVGASLYRLCVPSAFGRRAEFDMDTSHIFPQDVLGAITFIRGGAGDGRATAGARCLIGFILCSMAITT